MSKQVITGYYRVGSESQISKRLDAIRSAIIDEEKRMKALAAEFMESSEKYNNLRAKQRSLMGQMFTERK